MTLQKQIMEDLKAAMKARDIPTRDALRLLKTAITEAEIKSGKALEKPAVIELVMRAVKTRKDSAAQYEDAGRDELAAKERAEIISLEGYLPTQMTEDEARDVIVAIAAKLGLTEKKQMGQLMKAVLAEHRGVIDGKLASKIVGSVLS